MNLEMLDSVLWVATLTTSTALAIIGGHKWKAAVLAVVAVLALLVVIANIYEAHQ